MTLGSRTYIWKASVEQIKQNPYGITDTFGDAQFVIIQHEYWPVYSNNCHNVFLNHMFRFSILVGGIYSALFVLIVLFAAKRNFSIQTIFIWIALFVPMTMDHALTIIEFTFLLLIVFIMFFQDLSPKERVTTKTKYEL